MDRMLLVALGGGLGSLLRYLAVGAVMRWVGGEFPLGTLLVNVSGSFAIGLVQQAAAEARVLDESTRLLLVTGLLGGFTTYSAFSWETVQLAGSGAAGLAWLNVLATTALCLAGCVAGMLLGRLLFGRG
jgi:CrcB protein